MVNVGFVSEWFKDKKFNDKKNENKYEAQLACVSRVNYWPTELEKLWRTWKAVGELEKLWKHSPAARIPEAFLVLPNFHSCFYNSIETRYMFSIS